MTSSTVSDMAYKQADNETLVQLVRAGEHAAFCELIARYGTLARRTATSIVKNREDAEDAVQDASLRAFLKIDSFEGNSSFSTWFIRIVINSCLMQLRRRRTRPLCSLDELLSDEGPANFALPHPGQSPEQQCCGGELRHRLQDAIRRLPELLQEVAQDRLYDELAIAELAAKRGITITAAKSRLFRARRMLGRSLAYAVSQ